MAVETITGHCDGGGVGGGGSSFTRPGVVVVFLSGSAIVPERFSLLFS